MCKKVVIALSILLFVGCHGKNKTDVPLLISKASETSGDQGSQTKVVKDFYEIVLLDQHGGIPSESLTKRVSLYLSKSLLLLIRDARDEETRFRAKASNTGPGPFEGYPFVSPGEGASKITNIERDLQKTNSYRVHLCSISKKDHSMYDPMTVRIVIIREDSRWVIDDIYYYQDSADADRVGLRSYLNAGISDLRSSK